MTFTTEASSFVAAQFAMAASFDARIWASFHPGDLSAFSKVLLQYGVLLRKARRKATLLSGCTLGVCLGVAWTLLQCDPLKALFKHDAGWGALLLALGVVVWLAAQRAAAVRLGPLRPEARLADLRCLHFREKLLGLLQRQVFARSAGDCCDLRTAEVTSEHWDLDSSRIDVQVVLQEPCGRCWEVHYMWWEQRHHLVVLPRVSPRPVRAMQAA